MKSTPMALAVSCARSAAHADEWMGWQIPRIFLMGDPGMPMARFMSPRVTALSTPPLMDTTAAERPQRDMYSLNMAHFFSTQPSTLKARSARYSASFAASSGWSSRSAAVEVRAAIFVKSKRKIRTLSWCSS